MPEFIFHRLVQRDLRSALDYYDGEGGSKLGDRFFIEVEAAVASIMQNPQGHHFSDGELRRVSLKSFPYHFLYEVDDHAV
ncbi:MAG: type II toxin-antitoxin system RelE/ParE family toxin [Verrucomicrobiaceae bacterium]